MPGGLAPLSMPYLRPCRHENEPLAKVERWRKLGPVVVSWLRVTYRDWRGRGSRQASLTTQPDAPSSDGGLFLAQTREALANTRQALLRSAQRCQMLRMMPEGTERTERTDKVVGL